MASRSVDRKHASDTVQPEQAARWWAIKPRNSILGGVFALITGMLAVHPLSPANAAVSLTRDELRADITQAYELLKNHHPNLSAHISRKDFDALHQRLLEEVGESNTQDEAFFAIAELFASVCDEHTRIIPGRPDRILLPDGWPWYEFPLFVDDGRLFMEEFQTGKMEEVLSIDGIAGPDLAAALAARSPNDGCFDGTTLVVNEALLIYGSLMGKMIGYDGPYKVRTRAPDSQEVTERTVRAAGHFVSSTHRNQFRKQQDRVLRTGLLVDDFRQRHLGFAVGKAGLDYRFSRRHNAAYLGVDSFKTPEKAEKGVELVMRDIIEQNPDRLIIDLVDNSGGATGTAQQLLAFLLPRAHRLHHRVRVKNLKKQRPENFEYFDEEAEELHNYNVRFFRKIKPKRGVRSAPMRRKSFGKPDYKGEIIVLISPTSRSNSIRVASNLKRLRGAKIVGSPPPTDTVTYCARGHGDFTLDHSGFVLNIPEQCYDSPENRFNDEATLVPDIEVDVLDGPLAELNIRIIDAALGKRPTARTVRKDLPVITGEEDPPVAVAATPVSRAELRADITQAYELLKKHHPNLHAHTGHEELDALVQRLLEATGDETSPLDAYGVLTELVGAVCDEHTLIAMDNEDPSALPQGWPWYDYPMIVEAGNLYAQRPGARIKDKIVSIGGFKGSEIAASLAVRYPSNGCLDDGTLFVNEALPVSGNIVIGMIGEGPHVVKFQAPNSPWPKAPKRTQLVSAEGQFDLVRDRRRVSRNRAANVKKELHSLGFQQQNLGREQNLAGLDYWHSSDHDMAYLGLNSFKRLEQSADGIELVMRDVIKKNPATLMIDLMGNRGESTETAQLLMAFLLPKAHRLHETVHARDISKTRAPNFEFFDDKAEERHSNDARVFRNKKSKAGIRSVPVERRSLGKPDYKGRLYVLLDPVSRSNSIKVAANLKRLRDATIVGSVTATNTTTSCQRANGAFKLEHTQFKLHIPEVCTRSQGNRFNEEATLAPDIPVKPVYTPLDELNSWTIKAAIDAHQQVATN